MTLEDVADDEIVRSSFVPLGQWTQLDSAILTTDGATPDLIKQLDEQFPKFKLFTGAFEGGTKKDAEGSIIKTLHCTASSTIEDLHGDVMTLSCVQDMAKQARKGPLGKGLTIFLNHKYSAPEDVAGRVTQASAQSSGVKDEEGAEIWDLHYDISLTRNNPRVDQTYAQITEDGISLGVSIGAYILEYDYRDKEAGFWGGLIINKILLVETSIVGIPANQRSWVQNAVMAVGKHLGLKDLFDSSEPDFRLEKRLWKVLDGKETAPLMKTASITPSQETIDTITKVLTDQASVQGLTTEDASAEAPADAQEVEQAAPVQESTAEEPTVTDEAQPSGTEETSAVADAAPEIANSLESGNTPAVELVLAALERAATELRAARVRNAELEGQVTVLTGERDSAVKDVEQAAQIVAIIARSPLGRKTQFAAPVGTFASKFSGIYDEAFLNLLDQE